VGCCPGPRRLTHLTVFDAYSAQDTASEAIQVSNAAGDLPPAARIVASAIEENGPLTVRLSCDCQPGSSPIAVYHWDLANGEQRTTPQVETQLQPGGYHVQLTVVDTAGLTASDRVFIRVSDGALIPPWCIASADPPAGDAPLATVWTGHALVGTGEITRQEWSLDGVTVDGAIARRTYASGTHRATFTVVDSNGLSCSSAAQATATSGGRVPPRILSVPIAAARCGQAYEYRAIAAGDGPFGWSLDAAPEGMTVDPLTGEVRWLPSSGGSGESTVTLTVTGSGGRDTQQFGVDSTCTLSVGCACSNSAGLGPFALIAILWWASGRRCRAD
jgi:hypothetical protein